MSDKVAHVLENPSHVNINRNAVKRSLGHETKAFISNNIEAIESFLDPTIEGFSRDLAGLEGPRGRILERSFKEATTAWEKFFWASLGRHWIKGDLDLEESVKAAELDLLELSQVLETVVVLEALSVTQKVEALGRIEWETSTVVPVARRPNPSVTRPVFSVIQSKDIEDEEFLTLDPTEQVDLEPRYALLGPIPSDHMRSSGPEDTTIVERLVGRPKL